MATTVGEHTKRDHDDFRLIFERLRKSTGDEAAFREEVYPFLIDRVQAHAVAEEAAVFPQLERNDALMPVTLVLIKEHMAMDTLADDLSETPYDARTWRARVFPLFDMISRRWAREETDVFPRRTISRRRPSRRPEQSSSGCSSANRQSRNCTAGCRRDFRRGDVHGHVRYGPGHHGQEPGTAAA